MELNKAYLAIPLTPTRDGFLSKSKEEITFSQVHRHQVSEGLLLRLLQLNS